MYTTLQNSLLLDSPENVVCIGYSLKCVRPHVICITTLTGKTANLKMPPILAASCILREPKIYISPDTYTHLTVHVWILESAGYGGQ